MEPGKKLMSNMTDKEKSALLKEYVQENKSINTSLFEISGNVILSNRKERRKKLKWLKSELKKHMNKKPHVAHDPSEEIEEEVLKTRIHKMRHWATRYGILIKKINELENYEPQGSSKGGDK